MKRVVTKQCSLLNIRLFKTAYTRLSVRIFKLLFLSVLPEGELGSGPPGKSKVICDVLCDFRSC